MSDAELDERRLQEGNNFFPFFLRRDGGKY